MCYLIVLALVILSVIVVLLGILITFKYYGYKYILNLNELPIECDVIIVLGAGIRSDGEPCDLLKDRLFTSSNVFQYEKCKKILLTGDNRDDSRNEVKTMKLWLIENYLKERITNEEILEDNEGYCTYDSMYRAKEIFNINKAIISTNRYHLPRAIYIARRIGIEAYGIESDLRMYDRMKKYKRREFLAQIKDFILVNFMKITKKIK